MSFTLTIDESRWLTSLYDAVEARPGIVPVVKGNGYGFGRERLAAVSARLGVDTVAVGTLSEVASVRAAFRGRIVVMAPLSFTEATTLPPPSSQQAGIIRTVAQARVIHQLAARESGHEIVLELDSPVHRHGIPLSELESLAEPLRRLRLVGMAMHLPIGGNRREAINSVQHAVRRLRDAGIDIDTLWLSHLSPTELAAVAALEPELRIRLRVGTDLWLADRGASVATGTILDARPVGRGLTVGYRQRRIAGGTLVIVSGGTGHGIGLQAGPAHGGLRHRLRGALRGAAFGAGWSPSPFQWQGRRLPFADVAHMQVSMLLVPPGVIPPRPGERLVCDVRMTVSTFDEIELTAVKPADGREVRR